MESKEPFEGTGLHGLYTCALAQQDVLYEDVLPESSQRGPCLHFALTANRPRKMFFQIFHFGTTGKWTALMRSEFCRKTFEALQYVRCDLPVNTGKVIVIKQRFNQNLRDEWLYLEIHCDLPGNFQAALGVRTGIIARMPSDFSPSEVVHRMTWTFTDPSTDEYVDSGESFHHGQQLHRGAGKHHFLQGAQNGMCLSAVLNGRAFTYGFASPITYLIFKLYNRFLK
ncbi:hypothetical protein CVT25_001654 [Psilocybe cyanescens]|uniref:Uncharacterized protein n=1 Tax=Psilocybe cyanescens TaxID=93625 RepID=A0A409WQ73_PSICY|nr:hypothetical protein CVT25_001654 [Psilocybe cyanescens]